MRAAISLALLLKLSLGLTQIHNTQINSVDSLLTSNPKNVVVFIYTDWCKYCHKMKAITLKNQEVINYINKNFYFCALNAESEKPLTLNKHKFKFTPHGNGVGTHDLATALGTINGELNYPTICILNDKHEIIFQYSSYLKTKDFLKVLEASIK